MAQVDLFLRGDVLHNRKSTSILLVNCLVTKLSKQLMTNNLNNSHSTIFDSVLNKGLR